GWEACPRDKQAGNRLMRRALGLLAFLPLSIAACGTAAGATYDPPLLSFNGTIASSSVATAATVRVALVWKLPDSAGASLQAAQELAVRAEFPATFHLDVGQLPPPEVITPIESTKTGPTAATGYAFGTLVVYEDTNGNGKLDLVPIDG